MIGSTPPQSLVDVGSIALDTAKIRALREKLGYTHQQAAEKAGIVGRQAWNDIENGRRQNITLQSLERIAAALGVKAKDLLK